MSPLRGLELVVGWLYPQLALCGLLIGRPLRGLAQSLPRYRLQVRRYSNLTETSLDTPTSSIVTP
jgi:hypothetical protein